MFHINLTTLFVIGQNIIKWDTIDIDAKSWQSPSLDWTSFSPTQEKKTNVLLDYGECFALQSICIPLKKVTYQIRIELTIPCQPSEGAELVVTTPNSTPSSIRNRRRTSSTTAVTIPLTSQTSRSGAGPADQVGVRDRNPSEDMSNPSRCTTPAAYEVPPYEPRQFPLSRSTYEAMVNNTEAATAVFIGMQVLPNANTPPVKAFWPIFRGTWYSVWI